MNNDTAATILESLAFGVRLDIYRLLVKKGPDGLVAGDIAATLGIAPNSLSFHLKTLTQAGMLAVQQEGRFMRYRANIPLMLDLIAFLTEECCVDQPEACATMRAASRCRPEVLPPLHTPEKPS